MANILKEIEARYPVSNILVNEGQVWPILRMEIFYKHREIISKNTSPRFPSDQPSNAKKKEIKNIYYGWKNWFKSYDFLALSNSREGIKIKINNEYYDRLIDPIIDVVSKEKFLYIERPYPVHHPVNEVHTKKIVSYYPILFLSYIFNKFIKLQRIKGEETLELIKNNYNLIINERNLLIQFFIRKKVFKIIYKLLKPKILFVVCYYDNMAAIKAAKEMGIIVVEVQHGVIGTEHPAYNIFIDLDDSYFPDYLLVYGKGDIKPFTSSKFIDVENVHPVGSYYIEYVKKTLASESKLPKDLSNYSRRVGVTLQWTIEDRMIDFIGKAARLDDSICYVLIPRQPVQRDYTVLELPENVKVILDENFYQIMMYVDFHSTVNSTCALEAPSLGVQNIMIDIDNMSISYYRDILDDENITKYVDTPEEYVNTIKSFKKLDTETIIQSNENNIVPNYLDNIKKFIIKLYQ